METRPTEIKTFLHTDYTEVSYSCAKSLKLPN